MATKRHVPKFHRATPAVRREALVEATLSCLKQYGHEGVSVRRISAAAGVSIGLINHHFPSKSGLIAETYETLALSLLDSIRRQAENKSVSPRDRLSNFFRASFTPEILDPQLFNVWLVFWSMVAHSSEIRAVHFSTYAKYRAVLESLLGQLVDSGAAPPFRLRPAAIALSALLDGFWVELSLSPTVFKPREAIAHCEDWVNALCRGDFPHLLGASRGKKTDGVAKRRKS
ncbi:MAG TPA: TetR family transcriptional regulator C-terminal domain-containing protein [Steroidobacteraceae bacterium]|jgi:TetR/AcrR family transcriptional repressor of bet genes|nr:TetR family transcriptional regulator C-terminal domain-containing protein [Steroidobacteraceae bacterium]